MATRKINEEDVIVGIKRYNELLDYEKAAKSTEKYIWVWRNNLTGVGLTLGNDATDGVIVKELLDSSNIIIEQTNKIEDLKNQIRKNEHIQYTLDEYRKVFDKLENKWWYKLFNSSVYRPLNKYNPWIDII